MTTPQFSPIQKLGQTPMLELADSVHQCVYRPLQMACMPLLYPTRRLTPIEFDQQLASGRRRSGSFLYYTACQSCQACEPSRLRIQDFEMTTSMRRVFNRGNREWSMQVGPPREDAQRLKLFNQHRMQRGLSAADDPYSFDDFHGFLFESCCDTVEFSFWDGKRLVGCSVVDLGRVSMSAVYTYFDPDYSKGSPGTYAILSQIAWGRQQEMEYLYLGMYVVDNQHLKYKARFAPQERFVQGKWVAFDAPSENWSGKNEKIPK